MIYFYILTILKILFVIDRIRLIDRFEGMAVKEGYIIDKSIYANCIGGQSEPIFRIRENLLNIFAKIHETKITSEETTNVYYFKEFLRKGMERTNRYNCTGFLITQQQEEFAYNHKYCGFQQFLLMAIVLQEEEM